MLLRTSRKTCQVIKTAGEELLLPSQIDAVDIESYSDSHQPVLNRTLWEEFVQAIQTFFSHRANLSILSKKSPPYVIPYCRFTKLIIYYMGSRHNIHRRPASPIHVTGDDFLLVPVDGVTIRKPVSGVTRSLPVVERKGKGITTDEQEASTRPSVQPEDDTSANIVRDTPSPPYAETGAEAEMSDSNLTFVPKGEKDEVFRNVIPQVLIMETIQNSEYYHSYLEMVARNTTTKEGGKKKTASKADKPQKPTSTKQSKPAPTKQTKHVKEKTTQPSPIKKIRKGKVTKIRKGKSSLQLVDEDEEVQHEPEPQVEDEEYDL
nr:hypothetical protein [Tanacetum cinerariifolium]